MDILKFEVLPRNILDGVQIVHQLVFEGDTLKESKLGHKKGFFAFVSMEDNVVTGFKFGYEIEEGIFYSWLGGVHPAYQKRGIASQLMQRSMMNVRSAAISGYVLIATMHERR